MVEETAGQGFLLTNIEFEHHIVLKHIILLVQLWVEGEPPTIEWSWLPRKIVREKRLSFRGQIYCILLYY